MDTTQKLIEQLTFEDAERHQQPPLGPPGVDDSRDPDRIKQLGQADVPGSDNISDLPALTAYMVLEDANAEIYVAKCSMSGRVIDVVP